MRRQRGVVKSFLTFLFDYLTMYAHTLHMQGNKALKTLSKNTDEKIMKTRIQVSIHPELVVVAQKHMTQLKYSSFSCYLESLIRAEQERREHSSKNLLASPHAIAKATSASL